MFLYILRKILSAIPILFGVMLVVFVLFHLVGGDPTYQMLGPHASAKQIAELRHELGMDQPKWMQFFAYLKQVVTFDFGRSYMNQQKISEMILRGLGPTMSIAVPAFVITTVLSVAIALLVSYFKGRWIDRVVVVICVAGMSVSMLAYILFGQYFLAYKYNYFHLFEISGYEPGWPDKFRYVSLPILLWVVVSLGYDVRFFRTAILEETSHDYVRTARAKGLAEHVIYLKHILKNSLVPIITNVTSQIPMLILGSFLLESFFSIPGVGRITIDALYGSDFAVIKTMTTLLAILFIFVNILTDILYTLVDPRVKLQ